MDNKKGNITAKNVQKSGKSVFVYLPTEWCKDNGLLDGGSIFLERKQSGELVLHPSTPKAEAPVRTLNLKDIPASLLDKVIASSYLAGLNSFIISGQDIGKKVEKIDIKGVLPGMELMAIDTNCVEFNCTIKLENIKDVQQAMMKKVINQVHLIGHVDRKMTHRLEDDVDKNRFLLERALRTALVDQVYRRQLEITPVKCLYFIYCARLWERISDNLREIRINDKNIIAKIEDTITTLYFTVTEPSMKNIEKANLKLAELQKAVNKKSIQANINAEKKVGTFNVVDYVLIQRMINNIESIIEITLDDFNTHQIVEKEN